MISKKDYARINKEFHDGAYKSGYGIQYPEGHVIRIYQRILKYELGIDGSGKENLLDFGCGTGAHVQYFDRLGFNVFGVDIDPTAILKCREQVPHRENFLRVSPSTPSLSDIDFGVKYDVVLANQVLYYLNQDDCQKVIDIMYETMNPGGMLAVTMMSRQHHFFKKASAHSDGIWEVNVTGRVNKKMYISFIGSEEELLARFNKFECLHVGFYDSALRKDEGQTHHYVFIGRKK